MEKDKNENILENKYGYLQKEMPYPLIGQFKMMWKKRFCSIENKNFSYYEDEEMGEIKGNIDFDSVCCEVTMTQEKNEKTFEISMLGNKRLFRFEAETSLIAYDWVETIRKHIEVSKGKSQQLSREGETEFWKKADTFDITANYD